mmetsp:Transcript_62461/g.103912  ORF Transcript_62461/g.103912 Transcript_62461/m.103912 type:complete len:239 (+) Transcript_62461:457-1173(+)
MLPTAPRSAARAIRAHRVLTSVLDVRQAARARQRSSTQTEQPLAPHCSGSARTRRNNLCTSLIEQFDVVLVGKHTLGQVTQPEILGRSREQSLALLLDNLPPDVCDPSGIDLLLHLLCALLLEAGAPVLEQPLDFPPMLDLFLAPFLRVEHVDPIVLGELVEHSRAESVLFLLFLLPFDRFELSLVLVGESYVEPLLNGPLHFLFLLHEDVLLGLLNHQLVTQPLHLIRLRLPSCHIG